MQPARPADDASQLTIGTQSVFCGTGIRALRAHKLKPDADEGARAERQPAARAEEARAPPRATHVGISSATVERQQWSSEYADMLQQLKVVKLEEAWEGRDAFAAMEMGIDAEGGERDEEAAAAAAAQPVRRRPGRAPPAQGGRAGSLSSSGGAEILTLDADSHHQPAASKVPRNLDEQTRTWRPRAPRSPVAMGVTS